MAVDPVCKMETDENFTAYLSEYNGKKYYFCSQLCKMDFDDPPEKYI
jgi:YHS domain-containing protein